VVDAKAEQLGIMTKEAALALAREKGLDLVLVSPGAKPPVAKLVNFSNFKYQQKKKQKGGGGTKSSELKELRLTPFIAENDLQTRIKKAKEFLGDGDRVKVNIKFVGRQITRKEFGDEVADKVVTGLTGFGIVDQQPKMQGKILSFTLKPAPKSIRKQVKPAEELAQK